jgi:FAD/FMN-containing dehydrogenase
VAFAGKVAPSDVFRSPALCRHTPLWEARAMSAVAERLGSAFAGELVEPGEPEYDTARAVWNAMVDRRPALIARCRTTHDVAVAVTAAREHGLELAVRCGGHSVAGHSVCDGGLVIDLGLMRDVDVDGARRTASVQGGALLGDVDRAAQRVGFVTPAGVVSHTGVGGLTLGGGFGWLSRLHGLSCDNLIGAEVVTAAGDTVTASEDEDAELLWALRGGGGNFGVVTRFDFRLHPHDGRVWTTTIAYAPAAAEAALSALAEVAAEAPRELTVAAGIGAGRASPFVPAEWHGRPVLVVSAVFMGDADDGASAVAPLRAVTSIGEATARTTYLDLQRSADEGAAHGLRRYWKGHFLPALGGAVRTTFLEEGLRLAEESSNGGYELFALGGAARDAPAGGSAFAHRDAEWDCLASARWSDPGDDEREIGAARRAGEAMAPYARGVYANDLADEGADRVRDAYGETYERLVRVKDRLDPENVFRRNQNVRPSRAR